MADRRDTYQRVRRWLLEAADEAVHIGFQLQCETTLEITAWAQMTNILEEGAIRATMARVTDMATQNLVSSTLSKSINSESRRLAEIAHYREWLKSTEKDWRRKSEKRQKLLLAKRQP